MGHNRNRRRDPVNRSAAMHFLRCNTSGEVMSGLQLIDFGSLIRRHGPALAGSLLCGCGSRVIILGVVLVVVLVVLLLLAALGG